MTSDGTMTTMSTDAMVVAFCCIVLLLVAIAAGAIRHAQQSAREARMYRSLNKPQRPERVSA